MVQKYLRAVCGSEFWDPTIIYDKNPDFTFCFQYTVLLWVPCFILWIIVPCWVYMLTKEQNFKIKISWLVISKTILTTLLIILEVINIVNAIRNSIPYYVYYITPSLLILTYILSLCITHYERYVGLRSSVLIFVFWLALFVDSLIILRSHILYNLEFGNYRDKYSFISFIIHFSLVTFNLILSCFTEKAKIKYKIDSNIKIYPENYVSLISRLFFWWLNPLIKTAYKRDISKEDLWQLEDTERSEYLTKKFENVWNPVAKKYMNAVRNLTKTEELQNADSAAMYKTKSSPNAKEDVTLTLDGQVKIIQSKIKEPSLGWTLCKIFGGKFIAGALLKLIQDILLFVGPMILGVLIDFIGDKEQSVYVGYFYAILLFITNFVQIFALQHYFHRMFIVSVRIRTALMNAVYKKSLILSTMARKESTIGKMVNLVAVDAQMFLNLMMYVNMVWSAPLQIIICLIMLWRYIGVATLVGFGTMIIFIPLNIVFTQISKKLRTKKMNVTDLRIKTTNEVLNGIKIIKFYGWEISFEKIISKIRENELTVLKKGAVFNAASGFTWIFAPIVVSVTSFAAYVLIDKNNILDAKTAFVCLSLFQILRFPLSMFPFVITSLIEASVAINRIRQFLLKDEISDDAITHENLDDICVSIKNGSFGWSNIEKPVLKDLNIDVKKGKLVAIVGSVGCGKSSLFSAILGEMYKLNGSINVYGTKAYVPQQSWIQNATLKANILFGYPEDNEFYEKIIEACALKNDLNILAAGDATEIGEKGINLSGGQRARVSLARSVYCNADIYLLDDPLSAVDAHVAKHIFDAVIGPNGILKNKTRLFVTNSLNFLPQVDEIIMIEDGNIVESGSYEELKKQNAVFVEFIKSYLENHETTKKNLENTEIMDESNIPRDQKFIRQISKLSTTSKAQNIDDKNGKAEEKAGEKLITKETSASGAVRLSTILEYLKACKWHWTIIFLIFYILSYVSALLSNLWLSDWTNEMQDVSNNTAANRNKRLIVYAVLSFLQSVFILFADWVFILMFIKASRNLHIALLNSILRSTMHFFESTPIGRILNRFSKDIEAIDTSIPDAYKVLIRCLLQVLLTVIIVSISTPFILIALVPILVLYIVFQRYFVASTRQLKRLESTSRSPIFSQFGETLNGISTIRAYNAQNRFITSMQNCIDENLIFYYPNTVSARWLAIRLEFIGTSIGFLAALFAVISRNTVSPGLAGLSISFSLNITQVLNWLIRQISDFEAYITSFERIKEYFETPHEAPWVVDDVKLRDSWPEKGHIKFNSYSVKYRPELDYVLKKLTFSIQPGEKIGIVGRTGAGKSSLSLGIFRILDENEGEIIIDDINIKEIGLHQLRQRITIIPQDPTLFSGTLRMNLDPFEQHSDDELWNALEKAHLKSFVSGLNKQLLYECEEGGENLSVGQRQLLCLARALLRKSKILLLDEATAAVDHNTDDLIQTTIRTAFLDCTILTIAHRINTIMDSSKIMVLDKGRIVEFDTPGALLANKNSIFFSLAKDASSNTV